MNLDHLRYFEAIARLQHYGKAAELLHVSQPNLNYAVSQLESELGVPLFEKSGRNVRLTRYGQLFLRSVQGTLETLDHPLAGRESLSLRDTLPYPQIGFAAHCGLRPAVDRLFAQIDARPAIAYETEEDAVIAGMVAAGFGIAVLPDDLLFPSLPLAVLTLTEPDPARTAYLNRKRGVQHPQAADRFFQFCKAALSNPKR